MNMLARILSSRVRAELFRLLFDAVPARLYLRELARRSDLALATIRQDAKKLVEMELLLEERDGNRTYYAANTRHPCYPDLRELVVKTVGIGYVLKRALGTSGIQVAFLFGSVARGEEAADSDIDLFVIGRVGLRELSARLRGTSETLSREVNPHCMTLDEFAARRQQGDHLVTAVMDSRRIFLAGTEHELEAVAE